ncbi:MAG: hypothetical protein QW057_01110 [Candidatus Bathyarchaeia archaeon]
MSVMAGGRVPSKEKKLVAVRGDLLARVVEISNREGKSVYGMTNEIFEQAIRVHDLGLSLTDVVEAYALLKMERETGAVIISSETLSYLIGRLYPEEKEALQELWRGSGQWYGKYLLAKFHDQDPIEMLRRRLVTCAWDVTDVNLVRNGDKVKLRIVAPYLAAENTELFSKHLEGIMQSLGYTLERNDTMRGIILLEFDKQKEAKPQQPRP